MSRASTAAAALAQAELAYSPGPAACPWCGGAAWTEPPLVPPRTRGPAAGFGVWCCGGCGLAVTRPTPRPEELAAAYADAYYGPTNRRFVGPMEWIVRWFRRRRADAMDRLVPARGGPPRRALDIGCGRGLTLADLRARGWEVQGVELHDAAARHARDKLGISVTVGGFTADAYPVDSFDAIVLWHVLEHLVAPRAALDGVARLLRPGGVLALAVPNRGSWQARWTGRHWFHWDLPRHLTHFDAPRLRRELEARGLVIVAERHLAWEQNPYGWLQSLLNCLGLRPQLLYDLLRRRGARSVDAPWHREPAAACATLIGAVLLAPLAIALSLAEALVGRGGTVEWHARKRETLRLESGRSQDGAESSP